MYIIEVHYKIINLVCLLNIVLTSSKAIARNKGEGPYKIAINQVFNQTRSNKGFMLSRANNSMTCESQDKENVEKKQIFFCFSSGSATDEVYLQSEIYAKILMGKFKTIYMKYMSKKNISSYVLQTGYKVKSSKLFIYAIVDQKERLQACLLFLDAVTDRSIQKKLFKNTFESVVCDNAYQNKSKLLRGVDKHLSHSDAGNGFYKYITVGVDQLSIAKEEKLYKKYLSQARLCFILDDIVLTENYMEKATNPGSNNEADHEKKIMHIVKFLSVFNCIGDGNQAQKQQRLRNQEINRLINPLNITEGDNEAEKSLKKSSAFPVSVKKKLITLISNHNTRSLYVSIKLYEYTIYSRKSTIYGNLSNISRFVSENTTNILKRYRYIEGAVKCNHRVQGKETILFCITINLTDFGLQNVNSILMVCKNILENTEDIPRTITTLEAKKKTFFASGRFLLSDFFFYDDIPGAFLGEFNKVLNNDNEIQKLMTDLSSTNNWLVILHINKSENLMRDTPNLGWYSSKSSGSNFETQKGRQMINEFCRFHGIEISKKSFSDLKHTFFNDYTVEDGKGILRYVHGKDFDQQHHQAKIFLNFAVDSTIINLCKHALDDLEHFIRNTYIYKENCIGYHLQNEFRYQIISNGIEIRLVMCTSFGLYITTRNVLSYFDHAATNKKSQTQTKPLVPSLNRSGTESKKDPQKTRVDLTKLINNCFLDILIVTQDHLQDFTNIFTKRADWFRGAEVSNSKCKLGQSHSCINMSNNYRGFGGIVNYMNDNNADIPKTERSVIFWTDKTYTIDKYTNLMYLKAIADDFMMQEQFRAVKVEIVCVAKHLYLKILKADATFNLTSFQNITKNLVKRKRQTVTWEKIKKKVIATYLHSLYNTSDQDYYQLIEHLHDCRAFSTSYKRDMLRSLQNFTLTDLVVPSIQFHWHEMYAI